MTAAGRGGGAGAGAGASGEASRSTGGGAGAGGGGGEEGGGAERRRLQLEAEETLGAEDDAVSVLEHARRLDGARGAPRCRPRDGDQGDGLVAPDVLVRAIDRRDAVVDRRFVHEADRGRAAAGQRGINSLLVVVGRGNLLEGLGSVLEVCVLSLVKGVVDAPPQSRRRVRALVAVVPGHFDQSRSSE